MEWVLAGGILCVVYAMGKCFPSKKQVQCISSLVIIQQMIKKDREKKENER